MNVGLNRDEETITTIRNIIKKPIRVDANEGWTDKEEAIRKIKPEHQESETRAGQMAAFGTTWR